MAIVTSACFIVLFVPDLPHQNFFGGCAGLAAAAGGFGNLVATSCGKANIAQNAQISAAKQAELDERIRALEAQIAQSHTDQRAPASP